MTPGPALLAAASWVLERQVRTIISSVAVHPASELDLDYDYKLFVDNNGPLSAVFSLSERMLDIG